MARKTVTIIVGTGDEATEFEKTFPNLRKDRHIRGERDSHHAHEAPTKRPILPAEQEIEAGLSAYFEEESD